MPQTVKNVNTPLNAAYNGGNLKVSKVDRLFYNRFFALFVFIASIILMFFLAFHPLMPGALLKNLTEGLICDSFGGFLTANMSNEAVKSLVSEGILGGIGGVLSFIPQIMILYLFLTFRTCVCNRRGF